MWHILVIPQHWVGGNRQIPGAHLFQGSETVLICQKKKKKKTSSPILAKFKQTFIKLLNTDQDEFGQDHHLETLQVSGLRHTLAALIWTKPTSLCALRLRYFQQLQLPAFQGVTWSLGSWGFWVNLGSNNSLAQKIGWTGPRRMTVSWGFSLTSTHICVSEHTFIHSYHNQQHTLSRFRCNPRKGVFLVRTATSKHDYFSNGI